MRILMLSSHYVDRTHGGVESHVLYLAEGLIRRGHEVLVGRASAGPSSSQLPENSPPFVHVPPLIKPSLGWLSSRVPGNFAHEYVERLMSNLGPRAGLEVLERFNPDIVHHHDLLENYRLARQAARRSSAPLVWTNHLGESLVLRRRALGRQVLNLLTRNFQYALAPSRELLEAVGASRHAIYCPNGVDVQRFAPDIARREEERQARGWNGRFVVLVPRRWAPTKGVHFLAEALRDRSSPDMHVVFVGSDTPGYPEYAARILEALGRTRITYEIVERAAPFEMVDYYSAADLAVFPSVLEATSLGILEAMATGCRVLGTNVGGTPEIVSDGETGYLCPAESAEALWHGIHRAASADEQAARTMTKRAREFVVEHFAWDHVAAVVERVYELATAS